MKTNTAVLRAASRVEASAQSLYADLAEFLVYEPRLRNLFHRLAAEDETTVTTTCSDVLPSRAVSHGVPAGPGRDVAHLHFFQGSPGRRATNPERTASIAVSMSHR